MLMANKPSLGLLTYRRLSITNGKQLIGHNCAEMESRRSYCLDPNLSWYNR